MELIVEYHQQAATLIARMFLGFLFFFQGYDAVFNLGLRTVTDTYHESFGKKGIPRNLTYAAAWYTSYTELIGGGMLILGLWTFQALYALGINLVIAGIGFGLNAPLWDTRNVYPRLLLVLLLLMIPAGWHQWSVDQLFNLFNK